MSESVGTVAVDALLDVDWTAASRDDLLDGLRALEVLRRRAEAVEHALLAAVTSRGVAGEVGCRSTAALLTQALRVSPGEARARVAAAELLGPRREVTGAVLAPVFPLLAAAQADGEISAGHARVVTDLVDRLPAAVAWEHAETVEATLVEHARTLHPGDLAKVAVRMEQLLNPDGRLTDDADRERHRGLTLTTLNDRTGRLTARLTPAALATWRAVLDALSAPAPAEDGTADGRTAAQRHHDALLEAGQRLLRDGDLPTQNGVPVTILATVTLADLDIPEAFATTGHGDLITLEELRGLTSDADVVTVLQSAAGGILSYGRRRRLASPAQRLALAARDHGCSFPGCTVPASWSQVHHTYEWADGGTTDVATMTLLCGFHHREFATRGWDCQMIDDVPHWRPPDWLDPTRTPRRNTAHQPLGP